MRRARVGRGRAVLTCRLLARFTRRLPNDKVGYEMMRFKRGVDLGVAGSLAALDVGF